MIYNREGELMGENGGGGLRQGGGEGREWRSWLNADRQKMPDNPTQQDLCGRSRAAPE